MLHTRGWPVRLSFAVLSALLVLATFAWPMLAPLGWFALTPLLLAVRIAGPLEAAGLGVVYSLVRALPLCEGLAHAFVEHAGLQSVPTWLGLALLVTLAIGSFDAAFALAARVLLRDLPLGIATALALAGAHTLAELARSHLLGLPPVALLGHTQHEAAFTRQLAELVGVPGIGFVLVFVAALLAAALQERPAFRERAQLFAAAFATVLATQAYGALRHFELERELADASARHVGVVQPDVPQSARWRPDLEAYRVGLLLALSEDLLTTNPDLPLIVWPETSLVSFDGETLPDEVRELFATGPELIVGAPVPQRRGELAANSALFARSGNVVRVYDKRVLFPVGEHDPFESSPWLSGRLPRLGHYVAGQAATVFETSSGRLAPLICFEALFPELARQALARELDAFSVLSNDAWFGAGLTSRMHAAMLTFRSVETRRPLLRAANVGATGWVDVLGTAHWLANAGRARAAVVELRATRAQTLFARYGDTTALAACFAAFALALARLIQPTLAKRYSSSSSSMSPRS